MDNEREGFEKMQNDFGLPGKVALEAKVRCERLFPMFQLQAVCMQNEKDGYDKMQQYRRHRTNASRNCTMLHTPDWASTAIIAANLLCAGFAVAAAILWYRSAVYQANPEDARQDSPEIMMGMKVPLIATLDGQGRLSRRAAATAACAAPLQAIKAFLQTFLPTP